jgi:hypothetical protein
VSGSGMPKTDNQQPTWYRLIDPATDRVVGHVTREGDVRSDDPAIEARIRAAYQRELVIENDVIAEELGVCFAGLEMVVPGDTTYFDLVFRNIGLLTGLIPERIPNPPDGA